MIPLRAIFDNGSNANFITESAVSKLGLVMTESNMQITMPDGTINKNIKQVKLTIKSRYPKHANFSIEITCLVVPSIPSCFPHRNINWKNFEGEMQPCFLADPKFNQKKSIDMIIGSEVANNCLLSDSQNLSNGVCVKESKFGWIVTGTFTDRYPM